MYSRNINFSIIRKQEELSMRLQRWGLGAIGYVIIIFLIHLSCSSLGNAFSHGYTTSSYQGEWWVVSPVDSVSGSKSGYKRLQMEMRYDKTIKSFVETSGLADYIYVYNQKAVALLYFKYNEIYLFKRYDSATSIMAETSGIYEVLSFEKVQEMKAIIRAIKY